MREILFRGKQVNKDKWIYGVPVKGTDDDESKILIIESVFKCDEYACRGCDFEPVIPSTIGQYTGLTDKNGNKIFDGDIVKGYTATGKIDFEKSVVSWDDLFSQWRADNQCLFGSRHCATYEIIGNIHDKPELLKGGVEG